MSSDPFDLLGLDRATATDADVRRAYAERLKVTRPEDDRAGFMTLRAAFERARDAVRWRAQQADVPYEDYEDGAEENCEAPAFDVLEIEPEPEDGIGYADRPHEETGTGRAELDFEARVDAGVRRLIDVLTQTGEAPPLGDVVDVLDHPEIAGIEEYQAMQWQVRQFLCDRTGGELEPPELRVPGWLTLEIFDTLDSYYGWSRQPAMQSWVRHKNDWLVRVRKEMAWAAMPAEARRQSALADAAADLFGSSDAGQQAGGRSGGGTIWLWIGAGILISQVVRVFANAGGG